MGPVPFKRIVFVSTEDAVCLGKNLLSSASGKKWLCAATDKTRKAEIEFELCKKTRIAELEIGNFGSAFVEVFVGCSDTDENCAELVTLLPQSALMSVPDCKAGRNKTRTARYTKERLSATAMAQKWNRLKVVCRQPFNLTEQFGLSHIVVFSQAMAAANESSPPAPNGPLISPKHSAVIPLSPTSNVPMPALSPHTPTNKVSTPLPHAPSNSGHSSLPLEVQSRSKPHDDSSATRKCSVGKDEACTVTTPKSSRRAARDSSPLSEFTGVEAQSRLLHNALKGIPHNDRFETETNPILLRIMAERDKYRTSPPVSHSKTPERRKLLDKELPAVDPKNNFVASYQTSSDATVLRGALARMAAHDQDYEIGEEPEFVWGRNGGKSKRRKKIQPTGCSEWLSKRKSDATISTDMIQPLQDVAVQVQPNAFINTEGAQLHAIGGQMLVNKEGCFGVALSDKIGHIEDREGSYNGVPPLIQIDMGCQLPVLTQAPPLNVEEIMPCPLCGVELPQYALIIHAASCELSAER